MAEVRKFKDADYECVIAILKEAQLFDDIWESEDNVKGMILKDPESVLVAVEKDKVVGNIFIVAYGPKLHYLFRLAVKKEYRKRGIGTSLIQEALKVVEKRGVSEVGMYVDAENTQLHSFYEKRGFKKSKNSYFYMWREK